MVEISEKQLLIAKLKSEGKKNKEIGAVVYPEATPHAQAVLISRELKKPNVAKYIEQGRDAALRKHGITFDRIMTKLNRLLDAEKTNMATGEIEPDNTTQLNAIRILLPMLDKPGEQTAKNDQTELIKAINSNMSDVELQRIIFNKSEPQKITKE